MVSIKDEWRYRGLKNLKPQEKFELSWPTLPGPWQYMQVALGLAQNVVPTKGLAVWKTQTNSLW